MFQPKKQSQKTILKTVGVGAGVAVLAALAVFTAQGFLFPAEPSGAIANGSEIGLNIKDFIKVAVDTDNLALHDASGDTAVTPEPSGTLVYGDVNVAVTTNTVRGYSLSVYTQDSSNSMRHQNSTVTDTIAPISSISGYNATTGASDLAGNTWGFRRNTGTTDSPSYTNWFAVGENANNNTVIYDTDTGNSAFCENLSYPLSSTGCDSGTYDTFNINFGAKLTSSLPAGTYTNNVVFSAVAKDEGARYTLDFHPNGGENVMANRTVIKGSTAVLPTNGFSLPGHTIKGWALTQADAEVASTTTSHPTPTSPTYNTYTAGQTVSVNDLITAAIAAGQSVEQNALINLYAIWDIAYTVTYNAGSNGTNIATGSAITNDTILSATLTIPGNTDDHFALEGYNFLGWALTDGATTVAYEEGDTPTMSSLITAAASAGQSVSATAPGNINLYGVWEEAVLYMQNFTCSNLSASGETVTAVDKRDGQEYTVYRIPTNATYYGTSTVANIAGKCIMTKDLNLGAVASVEGSSSTIVANGTMTLSPEDSTFSTPTGSGESITVPTSNVTVNMTWSTTDSYSNKHYHTNGTGNYAGRGYYSWGAAMVACPKGWRLPTADEYDNSTSWEGQTAGLAAIVKGANYSATISNITSSPWSFVLGGYYYNGFHNAGSDGFYWSSTQYDSTLSYTLYLNSSSGLLRDYNYKRLGFAVRCMAD
ncbi:hypothetical protein IJH19_00380 [Candidatus Saccharibacteria bacterium]|nr:hypothetical protein [Candidatus Saccharibacteria bacterium]